MNSSATNTGNNSVQPLKDSGTATKLSTFNHARTAIQLELIASDPAGANYLEKDLFVIDKNGNKITL